MNTGIVSVGGSSEQARSRPGPLGTALLLLALPVAWLLHTLAFQVPGLVETWYSQGLYPRVIRGLGRINGVLPLSLAEIGIVVAVLLALAWLRRSWRGPLGARLLRIALWVWGAAGLAAFAFLLLWGLNYARPSLLQRMQLDVTAITLEEIESLAVGMAEAAAASRAAAAAPPDFKQLDSTIDASYAALALPGDVITFATSPAKRPVMSLVMSRLGISGIYSPFTAEPTVNGDIPPSSLPLAVAHEKAHQRGITDEGEANLAATLVCLRADDAWIRYSAQLDLAARAINALGQERPEAATRAWRALGEGAHADLQAEREFWERHRGWASDTATRINDAYLHSQRVPGGVRSYERVLTLAVGAWRAGWLDVPAAAAAASSPAAEQLLAADREFARAAAEDGVDGWVRWFAPDGEMVGADGPPIRGREAIRAAMAPAFASDGFRLEWDPERAEIAAGGDLGVTYGAFREWRAVDGQSRTVRRGRYMTVWRRQPDGSWRVLMDIGTDATLDGPEA